MPQLIPDPVMWHAAPDYIRLTCKVAPNVSTLYSVYEHAGRTVADWLGESPRDDGPWGWNGYSGRCIGPVAWGQGHNGILLQVSGAGAEKVRQINPPWDNVPRLDVQITMWYDEYHEDIARRVADWSDKKRQAAHHRPWQVKLVGGYGEGDTCYLGSRKSALFLRTYDKLRESGNAEEWAYAWRFEAEVKEGKGAEVWEGPPKIVPGPAYWASYVVRCYESRGIYLPRALPGAMAPAERIPKGETTNAKRLRWLATQVAPSIATLRTAGVSGLHIARALTGDIDPSIMWALAGELSRSEPSK